jgi:AraC family transcriptional regulator
VFTGYAPRLLWAVPHVVLVTAGQVVIEDRALADRRFVAGSGSVTLWPGTHESKSITWEGPCETINVAVDGSTLQRLAPSVDHLADMRWTPRLGIHDPQLATIVRAMAADVASGCPGGGLYGEALSVALAAYVSERYSTTPASRQPQSPALSRRQLRRVLDYIRANLGRDLSLGELSRVAQLSPHHLCRDFKSAVGTTPHQYVMRERIREAERLLATRRASVAEVAFTTGFASQSHFTEMFRRATGRTPRRYQREH